jgi:GTP cyclohydrolase II
MPPKGRKSTKAKAAAAEKKEEKNPVQKRSREKSPKAVAAKPKKKMKHEGGFSNARKHHNPPLEHPTWEEIHQDLEDNKEIGCYGSCHGAYHGLAAIRAGVDMRLTHGQRSPDEYYEEKLSEHMKNPKTREQWKSIFTLDPLGMYGTVPTMSWTTACISFPELKESLVADGKIVDPRDMSINVTKVAIDYVWNIPKFAEACGLPEGQMREALELYTQNPQVRDTKRNAYLPPVGGATCFIIGDVRKIHDPSAEICVRVHDQCTGSDAMGTDICTCRPYLVYAAQAAAECAQRGGVGILVYYQKEGRSLGEVTKFRVYNARRAQEGGDRPEMYFHQTEQIAGIRDARFQEMMPDVLLWLGISRIDWLMSMSSEKYDAITSAGIRVMQRVALPEEWVPKNAGIEITAKVAAGYHSDDAANASHVQQLRSLSMVRERCNEIFTLASEGKARHFQLKMNKLDKCADYVVKTIRARYPSLDIPAHSRWRHLPTDEIKTMVDSWPVDDIEKARRKVDLCTVSVLLDAGAGDSWTYHSHTAGNLKRSEGLALASFDMFKEGLFSSDAAMPNRVNALGLETLTMAALAKGFQVTPSNTMLGLKGRHELLASLGKCMRQQGKYFGSEICRPGNIVDFVLQSVKNGKVSLKVLWEAIVVGLEPIWPKKGQQVGDVQLYTDLKKIAVPYSDFVPFHKLSQWLTYSMLEIFTEIGVTFTDLDLLTGLSEYRNGGLFIDFGVITPREKSVYDKTFHTGSELVVEWRALTVCLLDRVAPLVRAKLGKTEAEMPLASILEGGTWQAGRNIAAEKRPATGASPISLHLFGTTF